jgi:CubicO group peptidase (beta-lactamase class C family)
MRILIRIIGILAGLLLLGLVIAMLVYPPQYVLRVLAWQESDVFDWKKFPSHPLEASPQPFHFEESLDPRVADLFAELAAVEDWDGFLEEYQTQAFIVVQDGKVLYEKYFNDTQRDSIVTSFSMAKSFTSALTGIAIAEGYIQSIDDPVTRYLPELADRDPRFEQITIRHLLLMASGLEYQEFRPLLFNSDDPLTTYYPDQRELAFKNTHIIAPPGQYFSYNKYHPQLLGMILERTTGMPVTDYLQTRLWDPVGMAYSGSWSTDSTTSDFERMEAGINARAIDFAKFGLLYLNGGLMNNQQVIPQEWVAESTGPHFPEDYASYYPGWFASVPGKGYYAYMWWGYQRVAGSYDFAAEGDKGQFIYISPEKNLVIVRNGINYGIPAGDWIRLFYTFASRF